MFLFIEVKLLRLKDVVRCVLDFGPSIILGCINKRLELRDTEILIMRCRCRNHDSHKS